MTIRQIVLGGLLLLSACFTADRLRATEILWETSARQAQQFAVSSERPLLIYVGSTSCGYCRKLERTTWANETVATRVGEDFVPLKVDANRSPQIVRQLGVRAYPTTIVLAPNGTVLGRQSGYVGARAMLKFLQPSPPRYIQQAAATR